MEIDEGEGEDELEENQKAAGLTRSSCPQRLFHQIPSYPRLCTPTVRSVYGVRIRSLPALKFCRVQISSVWLNDEDKPS